MVEEDRLIIFSTFEFKTKLYVVPTLKVLHFRVWTRFPPRSKNAQIVALFHHQNAAASELRTLVVDHLRIVRILAETGKLRNNKDVLATFSLCNLCISAQMVKSHQLFYFFHGVSLKVALEKC